MARVEVAFGAGARHVDQVTLDLPAGATVRDAAAGVLQRRAITEDAVQCGVWGQRCAWNRVLRDGDRVEIYRPLSVDPKQARRLRCSSQRKAKRPAGAGR